MQISTISQSPIFSFARRRERKLDATCFLPASEIFDGKKETGVFCTQTTCEVNYSTLMYTIYLPTVKFRLQGPGL